MFAKRTNWSLETNRLSAALAALRASGKGLLDLTISNPTKCGFLYDEKAIREALSGAGVMDYEPNPRGILSARAAVAEYYAEKGVRVAVEDIFLTASTSEAYSFIFRLLSDPESEVLVPSPSYPLFDFLADIHDVRLIRYPLTYSDGWQIDFGEVHRAITERTRGIIVVHPNNPTGHYAKAAEMEQLNQICAARDLALIADEVFFDFSVEDGKERSSFAANSRALTFIMSGLSKISGLPQMKASWLTLGGTENLKTQAAARLEVITDTYLSVSTPVQVALPALLAQRHGFQKQLMARLRRNLAEMDRQLAESKSCSRLKVEGGWYAVLRIPKLRDDEEFAVEMLEKHSVYTHPGHFFDFSEPNHLVISLLEREEDFGEGLKRLLDYLG
ncbi:MAG TPA: pyridoxal phosphate-dependent aminotransferase [Verrucomicrobiae bacterium]|nr:pyridoxal phosphate-dependent aminotransferase [Verrucomicrobiae bacterium]